MTSINRKNLTRIGILGAAASLLYLLWQKWELTKFAVTNYKVSTEKVTKQHRIAVLADLHGFSYGRGNHRLLAAIRRMQPELILIAGDLIVSKYPQTYVQALETLQELVKIAPVYYGFGNHESRAVSRPAVAKGFEAYLQAAEKLGVTFLRNRSEQICLGGDVVSVCGLELDLMYYEKGFIRPMEQNGIKRCLGTVPEGLSMLLAHNPAYSEEYAAWGADVTFCGHNHGGLVRIPGIGGILSPQLTLFPKYGEGMHRIGGKHVVISRGLGTHTFHVRVFNRAELLQVTVKP